MIFPIRRVFVQLQSRLCLDAIQFDVDTRLPLSSRRSAAVQNLVVRRPVFRPSRALLLA
jgi:hypothetical protein